MCLGMCDDILSMPAASQLMVYIILAVQLADLRPWVLSGEDGCQLQ